MRSLFNFRFNLSFMNKKFFVIISVFALLCISDNCFASDTLYFTGHIKARKSVSFRYLIRFAVDSENNVTGYSLTDPQGPYETKTKIIGVFNPKKKSMTIEETTVLRTKAASQGDLCFVKARLKGKSNRLVGETLTGKFKGFNPNSKTVCAKGKIKLISAAAVKQMQRKEEEKEKRKKAKKQQEG